MKKLILLLLFSTASFSQEDPFVAFSAGVDVRNAIIGSNATNSSSALDMLYQFTMVGKGYQGDIIYENFPRLDFKKYALGVGKRFPLYAYVFGQEVKTTFTPSVEPTLIDRHGDWGGGLSHNSPSSHLSVGLSLSLDWKVFDNLSFGTVLNALPRTDLKAKYPQEALDDYLKIDKTPVVVSYYLKLTYRVGL